MYFIPVIVVVAWAVIVIAAFAWVTITLVETVNENNEAMESNLTPRVLLLALASSGLGGALLFFIARGQLDGLATLALAILFTGAALALKQRYGW